MAANKFATMLHRNTNKITLVLVYAILEWILIILLLLNSLFSYLIIKFADYFGLKRPCIWCTRIDHIIEPGKIKNSCKDLVCEAHAFEISKLGFCSDHHKLAESKDMCEDCSSSSQPNYIKLPQSFGFFPWMKQIGMIHDADDKKIEKVEVDLKCSCCGVNIERRFCSPCILLKPSLEDLDDEKKQNLITEGGVDAEIEDCDHLDQRGSDFVLDHHEEEQNTEENRGKNRGSHMLFEVQQGSGRREEEEADESCACSVCDGGMELVTDEIYKFDLAAEKGKETLKDETLNVLKLENDDHDDQPCGQNPSPVESTNGINVEIPPKHLDFFIHGDDCQLIPVELVDSPITENGNQSRYNMGGEEDFILDFDKSAEAEAEPVIENWHVSGDTLIDFSSHENKDVFKANTVESTQLWTRGLQEEENLMQNYQNVRFSQTAEDLSKDDDFEVNVERRDAELCSNVSQGCNYFLPQQFHLVLYYCSFS